MCNTSSVSPAPAEIAHTVRPEVSDEILPVLRNCEQRIGYSFRDKSLLLAALTHASGASHRLASNERLEFLGDAIFGYVICEMLYRQYPGLLEGDLTKLKSVVVSRQTCARVSRSLGLEEFLVLGKGMTTQPSVPPSLLADVFESLVAAIYLDGGEPAAREMIVRLMGPQIDLAIAGQAASNYKSSLQQIAQREKGTTPTYRVIAEKGPDHSKNFKVTALLGERQFQPSWGANKKEAEQRAAGNALAELAGEALPHPCDGE